MIETQFPVTVTFIALCAIALFPLVAWVGARRGPLKTLHGDGGDPQLRNRIRIHGNFIETAPIVALTIGAGELLGIDQIWLWSCLAGFILGRILHALWFDTMLRGYAMLPTLVPPMLLSVFILYKVWA